MNPSEDRQSPSAPLPPLWTGVVPSFAPAGRPDAASDSIDARFRRFHAANPWVYEALVKLARDYKSNGHDRVGMKMLFEVLRWSWTRSATIGDEFALNNSYTALYARMIMTQEDDLADIFQIRRRPSAVQDAA